jgi:transposase-like protein
MYRAVDQHGWVIDVLVSKRRDQDTARRFFRRALTALRVTPTEVVTDARTYPRCLTSWSQQPGNTSNNKKQSD